MSYAPAPRTITGHVSVLDLDPDLLLQVAPADRQLLGTIALPVLDVSNGPFELGWLSDMDAFGAVVLEGMLFHSLQVGAQPGMRILGPGDIIAAGQAPSSDLIVTSQWRAGAKTSIAPFGYEMMLAVRRAPRLLAGLHMRMAEQMERLTTQMTISQLPRVEDRLLSVLWLLAESFGHVTSAGTSLPLSLTHEMLGSLVGARRPTVSLALRELTDSGMILHLDDGWLLLERPAKLAPAEHGHDVPHLVGHHGTAWLRSPSELVAPTLPFSTLLETVNRLRAQHLRDRERVQERLQRSSETNRYAQEVRQRIESERRLRTPQLPSS